MEFFPERELFSTSDVSGGVTKIASAGGSVELLLVCCVIKRR
jgi:hypothetical protein